MNQLAKESSPYLLQHAQNPVNWVPWSNDVLDKAKKEGKLVLVSIGYAACHWCHVMEKECFEDVEVATYMNQHFIAIKVDREERPDIDQVYMNALQLMTQKGGWPLNCFCLPDGRPIYGGTYFPKENWMEVMSALIKTQQTEYSRMIEFAEKLEEGIRSSELITLPVVQTALIEDQLHQTVKVWEKNFDLKEGGAARAPKFPLPNNYLFLLFYGYNFKRASVEEHVKLTLNKMGQGGIFDQIGGGFSRYSVDVLWKVPHFEKMLYDNAQLIELYAMAYSIFGDLNYKQTVNQTFEWLKREMQCEHGGFYSALDADSEGEEGRFYCWKKEELITVLGDDYSWVEQYYSINKEGFWEHDKYILLKRQQDEIFAGKMAWSLATLHHNIARINKKLLKERHNRIRPSLDNKCLTSWNALLITAFCQAYISLNNVAYLDAAEKIGDWITRFQMQKNDRLFHNFAQGNGCIDGFLEDYACCIDAFVKLYQCTKNIKWLSKAEKLTHVVEKEFMHPDSKMCYFTNKENQLIARKMEIHDNVMPSSNSVMAKNFWVMGAYFANESWANHALQMLANASEEMISYGPGHSNWAILYLMALKGPIEVVCLESSPFSLNEHPIYPRERLIIKYHSEILDGAAHPKEGIHICANGTCFTPVFDQKSYLVQLGDL